MGQASKACFKETQKLPSFSSEKSVFKAFWKRLINMCFFGYRNVLNRALVIILWCTWLKCNCNNCKCILNHDKNCEGVSHACFAYFFLFSINGQILRAFFRFQCVKNVTDFENSQKYRQNRTHAHRHGNDNDNGIAKNSGYKVGAWKWQQR